LFAALLAAVPRARHAGLRLPVTAVTILRWHRDLVKRRWAAKSRRKRPGRPRRHPTITRLVLQMARDNEHWGYRRIAGELAGLGITVAASTVWEILKKHGIDPAPRRSGPSWAAFLRSQAGAIIACDFFTVDLLDSAKAYVMAVIEHASRRIHILGATVHPTHEWVTQQARNLLMDLDASAARIKFLIRDRDILYPASFDALLADAGIETVRSAVRAPRMNAIMERWIGGCRRELLDRMLVWVLYVTRLLADERRRRGTRRGTRLLTPFHQARFALAWFWDRCDVERLWRRVRAFEDHGVPVSRRGAVRPVGSGPEPARGVGAGERGGTGLPDFGRHDHRLRPADWDDDLQEGQGDRSVVLGQSPQLRRDLPRRSWIRTGSRGGSPMCFPGISTI
jgi:putative transposase